MEFVYTYKYLFTDNLKVYAMSKFNGNEGKECTNARHKLFTYIDKIKAKEHCFYSIIQYILDLKSFQHN